jgi:agmatinase
MQELNIVDYGDLAFDYAKVQEFPSLLEQHIFKILENDVSTIVLGGDHFITYPILKAYFKKLGEPLSILQFDAHSDTWPDDDEERIDHGTMFYKAVKSGIIDPKTSVQVGIRTTNENNLGVNIIDAREVHENGPVQVAKKIKSILGDRPAFAPGTGTPVWGGLSSGQAAILLRDIAGINMIGGDVVEVSPNYDNSGATAIAGAHVAMELLCIWGSNSKNKRA